MEAEMNKTITTIVIVLTLAVAYFGFQAANSAPMDQPSGNNISGGFDVCIGKQCEGKKELLLAAAEATRIAASWTPTSATPVPTQYPVIGEVAPVVGWGMTGILLLTFATTLVAAAIWFFFFELPKIKKKPVTGRSGTILSLEFEDGSRIVGNVNTVGGTHLLTVEGGQLRLEVDPDVAMNADANAAMRDAAISVGQKLGRNQLFDQAAKQMDNLLGTGLDGVAKVTAAAKGGSGESASKQE